MKKLLRKILLVDDDAVTNLLNEYILKSAGVSEQIVVCSSGEKALGLLTDPEIANEVDLIFLDINMPGMSGFEFINKYRKTNLPRYAPVVLMTTSISYKDKGLARRYEILGYFDKPLDKKKLNAFFARFVPTG